MQDVPRLATVRFDLRPLGRADAAALLPTLSDPAQCRFLSRPAFADEDQLWAWLADPDWSGRTWIAEDSRGEVAGRFIAKPGHDSGVVEIGYVTCADRQRQGVARECVGALVDHLVGAEGARKITAEVDADNVASRRLLESLGFTCEALFREHDTTHAGLCDVAIYGLLAREWKGTSPPD